MSETYEFKVYSGQGKNATCKTLTYERMSLEDVRKLGTGDRVDFLSRQGQVKQVKVTSVKTWKTRGDVRLGLKFGLYEYSYAEYNVDKETGEVSSHGEILLKEKTA